MKLPSTASALLLCTTVGLSFFTGTSQAQTLVNLVPGSIAAGNAACPDQPYYLYSGGKKDNFDDLLKDRAYPSSNLASYILNTGVPRVPYDTAMVAATFGDSFNLQNRRSVCYALVEFKAKSIGNIPWAVLTFGHVGPGGAPFDIVAQVLNPGATQSQQRYALDSAGRNLLSYQTGSQLNKTPEQSILDVFAWPDLELDFVRVYVWYDKNCGETNPSSC